MEQLLCSGTTTFHAGWQLTRGRRRACWRGRRQRRGRGLGGIGVHEQVQVVVVDVELRQPAIRSGWLSMLLKLLKGAPPEPRTHRGKSPGGPDVPSWCSGLSSPPAAGCTASISSSSSSSAPPPKSIAADSSPPRSPPSAASRCTSGSVSASAPAADAAPASSSPSSSSPDSWPTVGNRRSCSGDGNEPSGEDRASISPPGPTGGRRSRLPRPPLETTSSVRAGPSSWECSPLPPSSSLPSATAIPRSFPPPLHSRPDSWRPCSSGSP